MAKNAPPQLGEKLDYLPPGVRPDGRMLYGTSVTLQKLDMQVHGEGLWQAYSADKAGAIWVIVCNSGHFGSAPRILSFTFR